MMKTIMLIIALLSVSIIMLSGCVNLSKKEDYPAKTASLLESSTTLKFSDIPAPSGFKFLPEESYTFQSAGVRVGVLKYQGRADVEQVVNFYKDQMPLYNWNLLNAVEYGERLLLNFDREEETCIINLSSKGRNITITLSLGPKSRIRPKKSDKPVK